MNITYRLTTLETILPLRHDELIVKTNRTTDVFDGDYDESTFHFGAFALHESGHEELVGCASWMKSEWENQPAYQLRGMATKMGWQGKGIGKQLLVTGENHILSLRINQVWCNARIKAVPFYEKMGWTCIDVEFMIEGVGPHYKMKKTLKD